MNNNLKRAQAIIDCYNKNHPNSGCCCCFGPTGPTGPTGPAAAVSYTHLDVYKRQVALILLNE